MSKTQTTDYVFLSVNLRARENALLTRERLDRMADAQNYADAAKILTECGYPELEKLTDAELEGVFSARRAAVFDELEKLAPEPALVTAFRLKYDYHNVKALVKAEGTGADGTALLSVCGRVSPETLKKAFLEDDFRDVPAELGAAAREARSILARTSNPQLADFELDKAYFSEFLKIADGLSDGFLSGYARLCADVANLRAAVRCVRGHMDAAVLKTALIPGGNVSPEAILTAAYAPEGVVAVFSGGSLTAAAELGAQAVAGAPLADFELACDNALTRYMTQAKMVSYGPAVAAAFLASLEGEIVAARMVLLGKRSGLTPMLLRERLRESYD